MLVVTCEQVVDWACAALDRRKIAAAVDTLLSSARRVFEFVVVLLLLRSQTPDDALRPKGQVGLIDLPKTNG